MMPDVINLIPQFGGDLVSLAQYLLSAGYHNEANM
jgi:hypothetical protein